MNKYICLITTGHSMDIVSYENGEGSEYKIVNKCKCGKHMSKSEWIDDNYLMGYKQN